MGGWMFQLCSKRWIFVFVATDGICCKATMKHRAWHHNVNCTSTVIHCVCTFTVLYWYPSINMDNISSFSCTYSVCNWNMYLKKQVQVHTLGICMYSCTYFAYIFVPNVHTLIQIFVWICMYPVSISTHPGSLGSSQGIWKGYMQISTGSQQVLQQRK